MWVPGILDVLLFMANQFGLRSVQSGSSDFEAAARRWSWLDLALGRLRNPLTLLVILTLFALMTGFAKPPASVRVRWAKLATRLAMGAFHTILHLATAATVAWAATPHVDFADGSWYVALVVVFIAVVGAVLGAVALGLYLVLASTARHPPDRGLLGHPRRRATRTSSASTSRPDGRLTVYALGIDQVVKRWDLDPDNPDHEASYLKPHGDVEGRRPADRQDVVRGSRRRSASHRVLRCQRGESTTTGISRSVLRLVAGVVVVPAVKASQRRVRSSSFGDPRRASAASNRRSRSRHRGWRRG